ncbi:MAG TPA: DNA gyrase modulator, partial [Terriglobales bacterium]|nr:DNA gyrase modulator [Terriglobales bacterium]
MKDIASWALNTATQRGASYADARIVDDRQRTLMTKNGTVAHAADSETFGIGIRVIANGAWGFASTDNMSRESVEKTAAQAVNIAKASARVQGEELRLAPEKPAVADWTTPHQTDPFTTSLQQNLDLLMRVDEEL